MSEQNTPLFVERRSYRRRRLIDAARLLPIAAVFLLCLPMLWSSGAETAPRTSVVMVYVFLVWFGMAAVAAFIVAKLGDEVAEPPKSETP